MDYGAKVITEPSTQPVLVSLIERLRMETMEIKELTDTIMAKTLQLGDFRPIRPAEKEPELKPEPGMLGDIHGLIRGLNQSKQNMSDIVDALRKAIG